MFFGFNNAAVSFDLLEACTGHSGDYLTFLQLVESTGFGRMYFSQSCPYAQVFYVPADLLFFFYSFPYSFSLVLSIRRQRE